MSDKPSTGKTRFIRLGKFAVQIAILLLVIWGTWRTAQQGLDELTRSGISLRDLHAGWLIVSGIFYLAGMFPCGLFWHRVLVAMQQRPLLWDSIRAYFISQPGKYVPGKFMVVLLRTEFIRGQQVHYTLAVASIFVETLTMMSIGAALGAITLAITFAGDWRLVTFAVCTAVAVGVPTLPPVFRQIVKLTKLHRLHPEIDRSLAGLDFRVLALGWVGIAVGWFAMGLSLWATLQAIPGAESGVDLPGDLPLLTACVALATVAGFASGLPGGLGVRELVVMALVQPHFGPVAAILSAVVHRCVMVGADLLASGVVLLLKSRKPVE